MGQAMELTSHFSSDILSATDPFPAFQGSFRPSYWVGKAPIVFHNGDEHGCSKFLIDVDGRVILDAFSKLLASSFNKARQQCLFSLCRGRQSP